MQVIQLDPTLAASLDALQAGMKEEDIRAGAEQTVNEAIRDYIRDLQAQKLWKEQRAFEDQHKQLVGEYLGKYVAFHDEQMIDSDSNKRTLYIRVQRKYPGTVIGIFLVHETNDMVEHRFVGMRRVTENE